jgi:hypothetical protein
MTTEQKIIRAKVGLLCVGRAPNQAGALWQIPARRKGRTLCSPEFPKGPLSRSLTASSN